MRKIIIIFVLFAFYHNTTFSQNSFKYSKVSEGKYETVFTVLGIFDDNTANSFINKIIQESDVINGNIFYKRRCKISSKRELDFDRIREIAKSYNSDIQLGYCIINDKATYIEISEFSKNYKITDYTANIIPANQWVFPDDFPKKQDYKNISVYKQAKQDWIENNPIKWRDITGLEYLDFSINLDFKTK